MRTFCAWLVVVATLWVSAGCRRYVAVPVRVEDAETGAPIRDAVVRAEYAGTDGWRLIDFVPFATQMREIRRTTGQSDSNGITTVELTADAKTFFQGVSAEAKGFVESRPVPVSKEVIENVRRAGDDSREPVARIKMLAEPRPRVVLVIPDGYRGVIRVISRFSTKPYEPGERCFLHRVSPDRVINIEAPMLPTRYDYRSPTSFHARYDSGGDLPPRGRAMDTDVVLRVVDWRGEQCLLIVGTKADRKAANDYCNPDGLASEERWRKIWNSGSLPAETRP